MAELKYAPDGRLLFTKEMKEEYTILCPMMLPIHFELIKNVLENDGYHVELLKTTHDGIIRQGLKYVHNDACYPALLVVGQLLDAVKSGKYDVHKVALIITQTGGGCRASNYIHLLRKALKRSNLEFVPVISLNLSGLEKNEGFSLTLPLIRQMVVSITYGDLMMLLNNQVKPYELTKGDSEKLVDRWVTDLTAQYRKGKGLSRKAMKENMNHIISDFAAIPVLRVPKVKVGIVGEIYVKYSPLGNSNLEDFLYNEGAEVYVPGLMEFIIFLTDTRLVDSQLYGGNLVKNMVVKALMDYFIRSENDLIEALKPYPQFEAPAGYHHVKTLAKDYIGYGSKMGEGWLLTAEMIEMIEAGTNNIVCTQPFGCLPNHIVGRGMFRKIKDKNPNANIVAIDYDPGATKVNQENRIKLMLATARDNLDAELIAKGEQPLQKQNIPTPVSV